MTQRLMTMSNADQPIDKSGGPTIRNSLNAAKNDSPESSRRSVVSNDGQQNDLGTLLKERDIAGTQVFKEELMENKLAYKDMSNLYYYLATIFLFGLTLLGSCLIKDVEIIFGFVGCIAVTLLSFIIPSVFYLMAKSKFNRVDVINQFSP